MIQNGPLGSGPLAAPAAVLIGPLRHFNGVCDIIYDSEHDCCKTYELEHSGQQVPASYRNMEESSSKETAGPRLRPMM